MKADVASEIDSDEFAAQVLRLCVTHDSTDMLSWDIDSRGDLRCYANCGDAFVWGGADVQEVTPENIHELAQAFDELRPFGRAAQIHAGNLFAARERGMRPQGAVYPTDRRLWTLFDACGPERETGPGNPYSPGERSPNPQPQE